MTLQSGLCRTWSENNVSFLTRRLINFLLQETEDDEDLSEDFDSPLTPIHSPLIFKFSIIFMITQSMSRLFYFSSGRSMFPQSWSKLIEPVWPQEVLFGRILQFIVVNVFYIWRLYRADDWQCSMWFSS